MTKNKDSERTFLSTYLLHKDNRIRLPKAIESNLPVIPGETHFDIYFDVKSREIILKISKKVVNSVR